MFNKHWQVQTIQFNSLLSWLVILFFMQFVWGVKYYKQCAPEEKDTVEIVLVLWFVAISLIIFGVCYMVTVINAAFTLR